MEYRNNLANGIKGNPQPECMGAIAQPRAQFIELHVRQVEIVKDAVVECRAMGACSC
jgi:hypothetical protein